MSPPLLILILISTSFLPLPQIIHRRGTQLHLLQILPLLKIIHTHYYNTYVMKLSKEDNNLAHKGSPLDKMFCAKYSPDYRNERKWILKMRLSNGGLIHFFSSAKQELVKRTTSHRPPKRPRAPARHRCCASRPLSISTISSESSTLHRCD